MAQLLPIAVVAHAVGTTVRTVTRWTDDGKLGTPSLAPGCEKKRLLDRASVEAFTGPLDDQRLRKAWRRYRRFDEGAVMIPVDRG
jgi:hypothetical protein